MSKIEVNQISSQCGSTLTIGQSGDSIQLACGATQTGFGRTGTVNWDTTAKTASFTAVSGNGYFVNTTSGAVTVTLPASPSAGDIVSIADYTNTFQTNNVTVARNGSPIGGIAADAILSTEGQSVTFIYVDGTEGWKNVQDSTSNVTGNPFIVATGGTITCCGDYKIHTFTGPGTFTVTRAAISAPNNVVDYLVVAGGAGGGIGTSSGAGGGGAGGVRYYLNTTAAPMACAPAAPLNNYPSGTAITVTASPYPITVGGGGAARPLAAPPRCSGNDGSNSIFSTITSTGGGGGGTESPSAPEYTGNNGGSAGGGGYHVGTGGAGTGNTPPTSPAQGSNGGNFGGPSPSCRVGGGGGGFTNAGKPGLTCGGAGGNGGGFPTAFGTSGQPSGCFQYFSGGGGGQSQNNPGLVSAGGLGGGGRGANNCTPTLSGVSGTTNTGGGGGGGIVGRCSTSGGSGIVIIRYKFQ